MLRCFCSARPATPRSTAIHIVAEDFRFTPAVVRLAAGQPVRLVIRNGGRERHEFESPLLLAHARTENDLPGSLPVLPNKNAEAVVRTTAGIYLFCCTIPVMPA